MNNVSGHGAAVARAVRDREVAGSNPVAPTIFIYAGFKLYPKAKNVWSCLSPPAYYGIMLICGGMRFAHLHRRYGGRYY